MSGEQRVRRHLVDRRPENSRDTSRVLCIRAGECKAGLPVPLGERSWHGWTQDPGKVTCPRCLEWMHA